MAPSSHARSDPKRCATPGASSTLTFTSFIFPARSRAIWSSAGLTILHGPHHGAQRSMRTGTGAETMSSKLSSSASATHGTADRHFPQRGDPLAEAGTRFFVPQAAHSTTFVLVTDTAWALFWLVDARPSHTDAAVVQYERGGYDRVARVR